MDRVKELINDISRLAANNNCDLISSTIQEGIIDSTKNYVKDTWKTRWKADFFNWCKLMNEMEERFPRFVAFENMSFSIPNSGMIPTGAKHDITVDVITYRYKEKKIGDTATIALWCRRPALQGPHEQAERLHHEPFCGRLADFFDGPLKYRS